MQNKSRILFIVPYPLHVAPSQRFRVEMFLQVLAEKGFQYEISPFLDEKAWTVLYKRGFFFQKASGVLKGYFRRFKLILYGARGFEFVFIHREASPLGPPIFEWMLARLFKKKVIYDFDDALWLPGPGGGWVDWIKATWKIKYICRWAYKVAGGNDFLCDYARKFNEHVVMIPTCVDTEKAHNRLKDQNTDTVIIGWTGSHSTLDYLSSILPVFDKIAREHAIEFLIICNRPPAFTLPNLRYVPWSERTEVSDLLKMNIGVMPLAHDTWSEGKCGFKLIQYMALGIPAVASNVGVNSKIIDNNANGFLCNTTQEWYDALTLLVSNTAIREKFGLQGRAKIVERYSVLANAGLFINLFE